jgi:dTDP-4-dehydrorhamnose 3,5-epimerase
MGRVKPMADSGNGRPPVVLDIAAAPIKDRPTVTPGGERLEDVIDGVAIRPAVVQSDERGTITEICSEDWAFTGEPLVYVYQTTVRQGQKKGWVVHFEQDDRLFFDNGATKLVLYDARGGSPTHGMVNELFFGSANRALVRIPAGVFHAVVNIGETELRFINLPTRPYRHGDPDKQRLPVDSDAIPYRL